MRKYLRISCEHEHKWPNKDSPAVSTPIFTFKIPLFNLGGDSFSRDLGKLIKKNEKIKNSF